MLTSQLPASSIWGNPTELSGGRGRVGTRGQSCPLCLGLRRAQRRQRQGGDSGAILSALPGAAQSSMETEARWGLGGNPVRSVWGCAELNGGRGRVGTRGQSCPLCLGLRRAQWRQRQGGDSGAILSALPGAAQSSMETEAGWGLGGQSCPLCLGLRRAQRRQRQGGDSGGNPVRAAWGCAELNGGRGRWGLGGQSCPLCLGLRRAQWRQRQGGDSGAILSALPGAAQSSVEAEAGWGLGGNPVRSAWGCAELKDWTSPSQALSHQQGLYDLQLHHWPERGAGGGCLAAQPPPPPRPACSSSKK
ncbi:uncharacterized protein LOC115639364 [Gopherus evgoodei]|uniref:uncharacterized protein LOC115639364 n=1 Tax=Gopherus evgoodei TaxID=1825980 RepID=UPI0011CFF258|nr:uncharacterized protein LOC115639364 [Gopherus evgoodei]